MQAERRSKVLIYTDGACSGNPGPGAWAAVLVHSRKEGELVGYEPQTTNNRMEMMAVISALEALKRPCDVHLHTDSQYVIKGVQEWLPQWLRRGWKTASGGVVSNRDLWERLMLQTARHQIQWTWVRGHSGVPLNERVDQLARQRIEQERAAQS